MIGGSLGRRYAKALLAIAKDRGEVDRVGGDLAALARAVDASRELKDLLQNPIFARSQRRRVVEALVGDLGVSDTTKTFARLLVDRDRIEALPTIVRAYVSLADELAVRVRAAVSSAKALTDEERGALVQAITAATGREVILEEAVDPALVAGVVTRVGSIVYDGSLKTHLANLKEKLLA